MAYADGVVALVQKINDTTVVAYKTITAAVPTQLQNLFPRAWLFVGHASQVPNSGDYFSSWMGSDPVLLTRDDKGEVHVLLNSCRHRGMKVVRYDEGNTMQFTCPYHAWSYSIDGSLVDVPGDLHGVPHMKSAYQGLLDKAKWGLVRAPRVHNYKGLVFANWDPEAPDFDEYVGEFHWWLDNLADAFDGTEAGTEVFHGVLKWRIKSNWKFVSENFLGDTYHGASTHASVEAVGIGPGGKGKRRHGERQNQGGFSKGRMKTSFRLGHGASDNLDYELPYPEFAEPELTEYFDAAWDKRAEKLRAEGRPLGGRRGFHQASARCLIMSRSTSSWAICTAFSAAPLRRLSATTHRFSVLGWEASLRMRLT